MSARTTSASRTAATDSRGAGGPVLHRRAASRGTQLSDRVIRQKGGRRHGFFQDPASPETQGLSGTSGIRSAGMQSTRLRTLPTRSRSRFSAAMGRRSYAGATFVSQRSDEGRNALWPMSNGGRRGSFLFFQGHREQLAVYLSRGDDRGRAADTGSM